PVGFSLLDFPQKSPGIDINAVCRQLHTLAETLAELLQASGKTIVLGLEAEPGCYLESVADVCRFLTQTLPSYQRTAQPLLRRHIGICWDTCHEAVLYQEPEQTLEELLNSGLF